MMIGVGDHQYAVACSIRCWKTTAPQRSLPVSVKRGATAQNGTRAMIPGPVASSRPGSCCEVRDAQRAFRQPVLAVASTVRSIATAPYFDVTSRSAAMTAEALDGLTPLPDKSLQRSVVSGAASRSSRGIDTQFYILPTASISCRDTGR